MFGFRRRPKWRVGALNGDGWYWVRTGKDAVPFIAQYGTVDGKPTMMIREDQIPARALPQTKWWFCGPIEMPS